MKISTFSIIVGSAACNAACPFCVAKMTGNAPKGRPINWRRFETACQIVEQARDGLISVLLTGKGEPTLFPAQIYDYLKRMDYRFPLVDLQTNGVLLNENWLRTLASLGLTLVCISIAHYDPAESNRIMGIRPDYNFWGMVDLIHSVGLACRLNCTMTTCGVQHPADLEALVKGCKQHGVEQLTLREVDRPQRANNEHAIWVDAHKPHGAAANLRRYIFDCGGTELLRFPHGASVFDFLGQNVSISNCLTSSTDPNNIRQIIFFPDGRITYDWSHPGARIL